MHSEELKEITIRRAEVADTAIIVEYNRRLGEETEGVRLDPVKLTQGVRAALEDETKALYFVAEAAGSIVGQVMVTYEWSDWRNGVIWWIQSVYVDEGWRGRGVFRSLFGYVLEAGRAAGAVSFRLYVEQENADARAVYLRLGMRPAGYLVMEYGG